MMEMWNNGMLFLKEDSHFLRNSLKYQYEIFPMDQHPIFPEPIIPSFQYSNIPIGAKPLSSALGDYRVFEEI
jgi:hypothetical protein